MASKPSNEVGWFKVVTATYEQSIQNKISILKRISAIYMYKIYTVFVNIHILCVIDVYMPFNEIFHNKICHIYI
jgi:hypothetical protein